MINIIKTFTTTNFRFNSEIINQIHVSPDNKLKSEHRYKRMLKVHMSLILESKTVIKLRVKAMRAAGTIGGQFRKGRVVVTTGCWEEHSP